MFESDDYYFMNYHDCTSSDRELFYKQGDGGDAKNIEEVFFNLKCLDEPSQVNLLSHVFAQDHSVFGLYLTKCTGKSHCKSEEEIDQLISTMYLEIIFNQHVYIPTRFGDEDIIQERIVSKKFYLNPYTPLLIRNNIQKATL